MEAELRELVAQLRERILGLPDHPWVPGGCFTDGKLMEALERAEKALEEKS